MGTVTLSGILFPPASKGEIPETRQLSAVDAKAVAPAALFVRDINNPVTEAGGYKKPLRGFEYVTIITKR